MIDTIAGAQSSAIIYSIAETAKANGLKPYNYFQYPWEGMRMTMMQVFVRICFHGQIKYQKNVKKKLSNRAAFRIGCYCGGTRYEAFT